MSEVHSRVHTIEESSFRVKTFDPPKGGNGDTWFVQAILEMITPPPMSVLVGIGLLWVYIYANFVAVTAFQPHQKRLINDCHRRTPLPPAILPRNRVYVNLPVLLESKHGEEREELFCGATSATSATVTTTATTATILEGKSPQVLRLRKTIAQVITNAINNQQATPIVIMGPKGSGKPSIVEEIVKNLQSSNRTHVVHRLALDDALCFMDLFLGTTNSISSNSNLAVGSVEARGLLSLWADQIDSTVVIKGFESRTAANEDELNKRKILEHTVAQLLTQQTFTSRQMQQHENNNTTVPFLPRIIYSFHGTQEPDYLRGENNNGKDSILWIKVPSLELRTQDMASIAQSKINLLKKEYGMLQNNVELTKGAIQRLLDHKWSGGEPELDQELKNAILRLALERQQQDKGQMRLLLEPKHMMVETPDEAIRIRLLYQFPILRRIINSPWIFDRFQRYVVAPIFVAFLIVLFGGPQTRDHSAALTVFWAGWWPAVMLSFPLLGRIWCSICPFMIFGEFAQEAVTRMGVHLKKWPRDVERLGAPFAFWLFFAILCWEELWNLPQNGSLSAWLLILITSGAVFNSIQFEKRMWCRHLCPIGAMCRTFGTMSMTEVRSFKANCQGCTNPQCVNGDATADSGTDPSDTFALKGCTMDLKNNQLQDMGHCTLCMSCVKNCDKETPEVNLRPVGLDYGLPYLIPPVFQNSQNTAMSQVETNYWMGALLTVLQGSVLLHYMPRIFFDVGIDPTIATAGPAMDYEFYAHAFATVIVLALPGCLSLAVDRIALPLEDFSLRLRNVWGNPSIENEKERQMITASFESIMMMDKSLEATLEELDPDGDGRIACWEFERALRHGKLTVPQCNTIMELIRRRRGQRRIDSLPREEFLDTFQQLYIEAVGDTAKSRDKIQLKTTDSFVELFNKLDNDGDGFIRPGDFDALVDRGFRIQRTWEEKLELFQSADVVGQGRLNLFEFMTLMRKIAQAGIQEIGYGYLPLAWGSLTAYWVGLGLKELGLTLARLPDTFYVDKYVSFHGLSLVASDSTVQLVQAFLVLGSLPISIGLTQKLCNDNKITGLRFGLHAAVQVIGAWITIYLMLSSNPLVA